MASKYDGDPVYERMKADVLAMLEAAIDKGRALEREEVLLKAMDLVRSRPDFMPVAQSDNQHVVLTPGLENQ